MAHPSIPINQQQLMASHLVDKMAAAHLLEAVRSTVGHLSRARLNASGTESEEGKSLVQLYGRARRLLQFIERAFDTYEDPIPVEIGAGDQNLLASCLLMEFGATVQKTRRPKGREAEESFLRSKLQLLRHWIAAFATRQLGSIPGDPNAAEPEVKSVAHEVMTALGVQREVNMCFGAAPGAWQKDGEQGGGGVRSPVGGGRGRSRAVPGGAAAGRARAPGPTRPPGPFQQPGPPPAGYGAPPGRGAPSQEIAPPGHSMAGPGHAQGYPAGRGSPPEGYAAPPGGGRPPGRHPAGPRPAGPGRAPAAPGPDQPIRRSRPPHGHGAPEPDYPQSPARPRQGHGGPPAGYHAPSPQTPAPPRGYQQAPSPGYQPPSHGYAPPPEQGYGQYPEGYPPESYPGEGYHAEQDWDEGDYAGEAGRYDSLATHEGAIRRYLLDPNRLRDPRLRTLMSLDLDAWVRSLDAMDLRLAAVHLLSVLEGAVLDHTVPRAARMGLRGGPGTWRLQELLVAVVPGLAPADRGRLAMLERCQNLVRPARQLVEPMVVTETILADLAQFVIRVLTELGFRGEDE